MEGLDKVVVVLEDERYTVTKVKDPYVLTDEELGEITVENMIQGFEEDLYVLEMVDEDGDIHFDFAYVTMNLQDSKLLVTLQDDEVRLVATEVLFQALGGVEE
jgi:hypothetical protein